MMSSHHGPYVQGYTRSTGVGQKIDLEYNIETMRITDPGDSEGNISRGPTSSIMESIKAKSQAKAADALEGNTGSAPWEKPTGTIS